MSRRRAADAPALIRVPWTPARREPDHRSEMVTQWLCGERVRPVEEEGAWTRALGADGYSAWVTSAALMSAPAADDWEGSAAFSLGVEAVVEHAGRIYIPWGARVRRRTETTIELPEGAAAQILDQTAIVTLEELGSRFPSDGRSIVATADGWTGVPYLWGGRTDIGCDCSGLVQAIFRVHGIGLPRDSDQQAESGEVASGLVGSMRLQPADLIFFAPEQAGITHVAIATGGSGIIHCSATRGAVARDDLSADGALEELLRGSVVCVTKPCEGAALHGTSAPH